MDLDSAGQAVRVNGRIYREKAITIIAGHALWLG
jgi:hypothetical protein